MTLPDDLPPDLILVSCARCRLVMRGLRNRVKGFANVFPRVAGVCHGRPHCAKCLPVARREPRPPESSFGIVQTWE